MVSKWTHWSPKEGDYLITAPPSVCIPDVIGALAVWVQNQQKRKSRCLSVVVNTHTHTLTKSDQDFFFVVVGALALYG